MTEDPDGSFYRRLRSPRAVLVCALALSSGVGPGRVQGQQPDSTEVPREPLFSITDGYYAAGFIASAALLAPVDLQIAQALQDSTRQANRLLHDGATGFRILGNPGVLLVNTGMFVAGSVTGRRELADVGLHATEAYLVAEGITTLTKVVAGRARPREDPEDPFNLHLGKGWRNDGHSSFPSGHTTGAFATAAVLSSELRRIYPEQARWIGPVLYGGAALVGASRLYNNAHWASDVIVGAAIGDFAGWKVVRFNHTHPGNALDRWLPAVSVVPSADGDAVTVQAVMPLG